MEEDESFLNDFVVTSWGTQAPVCEEKNDGKDDEEWGFSFSYRWYYLNSREDRFGRACGFHSMCLLLQFDSFLTMYHV